MELKRSEISKIMKQDRSKDTPSERYARIQLHKDLKSRKRDKSILIFLTTIGFSMAMYAPKPASRIAGIAIMFFTSILSILV